MNSYTVLRGLPAILLIIFCHQSVRAQEATIIDASHYSQVFGETRNYRIFLPPGYAGNPGKKYPVIYFLHGWSQRYFGDGGEQYAGFDKGDQNNGDNIANFVSRHDVIIVKPDGYNRNPDEPYYKRPYNVSPVETSRQFPIYFPELVKYIDDHYRTIADRNHRAISGLSMGGFMTFWIGGKYPDLLSGAGNFCGSFEFQVGPKTFPVEYRHIDMYKNYAGMNLRLHYGDKDFIRSYHQDMNRIWPQLMDNYSWKIYDAEHSTCGMGDMFSFLLNTFQHPPQKPLKWDHIDVYPEFSVWDYLISSDRSVPGFTVIENADKRGFKSSVREFIPDGSLMPSVNLSVTTPAIYEKNEGYTINDVDLRNSKIIQKTIQSDNAGRLTISFNGSEHEIGINKKADKPNISVASVDLENTNWATQGKEVHLSIKLLNKGTVAAKNVTAKISATKDGTKIVRNESLYGNLGVNEIQKGKNPFIFQVENDSIEVIRLRIDVRDDNKNEWSQFVEIPVKKDLPDIINFEIADGRTITVARAGIDYETVLLGKGNGDGIANPGESIVLLAKDKDKYWRTNLSFSDKYLNPFRINERRSDNWTDMDHVGASAKYHVPLISSDCPEDHPMQFFAEYWLPEYPYHIIKQGVIKFNTRGRDITGPIVDTVTLRADNTVQARVYDGSKIKQVIAKFISKDDPSKSFSIELKDDGAGDDRAEEDNIFSRKIPEQKFGIYRVIIEASDLFGNNVSEETKGNFVVY